MSRFSVNERGAGWRATTADDACRRCIATRTGCSGGAGAVARYERFRDRAGHVLRCDICRHFPSIDHGMLVRPTCADASAASRPTLDLADRIIDGSNPQERVDRRSPQSSSSVGGACASAGASITQQRVALLRLTTGVTESNVLDQAVAVAAH